jgi:hypothetical protein
MKRLDPLGFNGKDKKPPTPFKVKRQRPAEPVKAPKEPELSPRGKLQLPIECRYQVNSLDAPNNTSVPATILPEPRSMKLFTEPSLDQTETEQARFSKGDKPFVMDAQPEEPESEPSEHPIQLP